MTRKPNLSHLYFWLLISISVGLAGLALALSWDYSQSGLPESACTCPSQLPTLIEPLSLIRQLILPAFVMMMVVRAGLTMTKQLRATWQLAHLFLPLREAPPAWVRERLAAHRLTEADLVYLNLAVTHAFCLGFWQPKIWLTAGLVNLLTDSELDIVLAHEAHHCRQRDPLRLLIGRTLKSALFFLPLAKDLANAAELQQEVAADLAAVAHVGDDKPLLCTLQKLLLKGSSPVLPVAAFSAFNVTEARIRRLVDRPHPFKWQPYLISGLANLSVITLLSGVVFLSLHPITPPVEAGRCGIAPAGVFQSYPPEGVRTGF